ncbi:hypothetical protein RFI_26275 [Reticulomyxa filosa]|uniref:Uncharacterized protein n=1 Tax=Reticulomyxa filosa TaxID=46433 RepID=X6MBP6_RETFI|nr:hypothetical protein RFI_26275 [Reticulomyxa filosa]|eukprot:ETO11101.1 hypothetical protein RFI_26275 [Reticulomyxa filosa]
MFLSFDGYPKHTLAMKYGSVWDNISNKSNDLKNFNEWIPFADQYHYYEGVRAMIGGRNNNLLFITYPNYILMIFNFHCFVSTSENGQGQKIDGKTNEKENKQHYQMLLFCEKTGLSIEYDEDKKHFSIS